jgi:tRNA-splicing ligase RtcB
MLPGITQYALCMPDSHCGYGFPIGGVAAMDVQRGGVISPGGIGFDINCGMRLVVTNLTHADVKPHLKTLVDRLFERVPTGAGSTGFVKLSRQEFRRVIEDGARWCVRNGYGWQEDLERFPRTKTCWSSWANNSPSTAVRWCNSSTHVSSG